MSPLPHMSQYELESKQRFSIIPFTWYPRLQPAMSKTRYKCNKSPNKSCHSVTTQLCKCHISYLLLQRIPFKSEYSFGVFELNYYKRLLTTLEQHQTSMLKQDIVSTYKPRGSIRTCKIRCYLPQKGFYPLFLYF